MSRLTSTQVIERGEYLNSDFDPSSLTMPHLLSILTFHAVKYPTPYNKSKLVQVFNEEIAPHVDQFKRERLKRLGSIASSHGITDGITGQSMSDDEPPSRQPPPSRITRRLSRPTPQVPLPEPEPTKRRRASAGPSLSRISSSKFVEPQEPPLLEVSEHEEEPARKVGRPRKSVAAAGPQARRVSQAEDGEGWSDNNVFQSGAESSSPARPSPSVRGSIVTRRSTRRGRTSLSAPPQVPSSPFTPPPSSPTFDPRLPVAATFKSRNMHLPKREATPDAPRAASGRFVPAMGYRSSSPVPEEEQEDVGAGEDEDSLEEAASYNAEISKTIANGGSDHALARRSVSESRKHIFLTRVFLVVMGLVLAALVIPYKIDSASIGYCYPGSTTNAILGERKAARMAAQECADLIAHRSEDADFNITCTPPPLLPLPVPVTCTPCPAHAYCTPDTVTCEPSFVLRQHPLARIPLLPQLLNGMPGLGPIAFPPRCVEDEARKRNIGRLGVALESYLALARGQKLCIGVAGPAHDVADDAVLWGLDFGRVHDQLRRVTVIQKKVVRADEFEGLFEQAIADLQRFGYVITGYDAGGTRYIAAVRAHLDFPCKIRVAVRNAWDEWKAYVFACVLLCMSVYWMKRKTVAQRIESRQVADLVQVALDTLRNQELAHHTDPVTTPKVYLSSLHLRDLILQNELSIPARRRLWDKVQRAVEGNTNVRASMEELEGGDEARVWTWVGGAHRSSVKSP